MKLTSQCDIAVRGFVDRTPYAEHETEQGEDWWDGKLLTKDERLLPSTHTAAFQAPKSRVGYTNGSGGKKGDIEEAWFSAVRDAFERMEEAMPDRDPPVPVGPALRAVKMEEAEPLPSPATRQTRSRAATPAATPTQRTKKTVAPPVPPIVSKVEQPVAVPGGTKLSEAVEAVAVSVPNDAPVDAGLPEAVQPAPAGAAALAEGDGVSTHPTPTASPAQQEMQTVESQKEAMAPSARPGKPLVRFTFKAGAIAPPPPPVVTP